MDGVSQLIYNDGKIKSRLIQKEPNWYVAEWKYIDDIDTQGQPQTTGKLVESGEDLNIWFPWVGGTAEYLCLSEQDKKWAKTSA